MKKNKGINRIGLVLAILSMIPGFLVVSEIYRSEMKIINPAVAAWEKEGYRLDSTDYFTGYILLNMKKEGAGGSIHLLALIDPPTWHLIIAGIVGSVFTFITILLIFRGTVNLAFWILEGFRDEN